MNWQQILPYIPAVLVLVGGVPTVWKAVLDLQKSKIDKEKAILEYVHTVRKQQQEIAGSSNKTQQADTKDDIPRPKLLSFPRRAIGISTTLMLFNLVMIAYEGLSRELSSPVISVMLLCLLAALLCFVYIVFRVLMVHIVNQGELNRYAVLKLGFSNLSATVDGIKIVNGHVDLLYKRANDIRSDIQQTG